MLEEESLESAGEKAQLPQDGRRVPTLRQGARGKRCGCCSEQLMEDTLLIPLWVSEVKVKGQAGCLLGEQREEVELEWTRSARALWG